MLKEVTIGTTVTMKNKEGETVTGTIKSKIPYSKKSYIVATTNKAYHTIITSNNIKVIGTVPYSYKIPCM